MSTPHASGAVVTWLQSPLMMTSTTFLAKGDPTAPLGMTGLHQRPIQAAPRLERPSVPSPNQPATLVGMHIHTRYTHLHFSALWRSWRLTLAAQMHCPVSRTNNVGCIPHFTGADNVLVCKAPHMRPETSLCCCRC